MLWSCMCWLCRLIRLIRLSTNFSINSKKSKSVLSFSRERRFSESSAPEVRLDLVDTWAGLAATTSSYRLRSVTQYKADGEQLTYRSLRPSMSVMHRMFVPVTSSILLFLWTSRIISRLSSCFPSFWIFGLNDDILYIPVSWIYPDTLPKQVPNIHYKQNIFITVHLDTARESSVSNEQRCVNILDMLHISSRRTDRIYEQEKALLGAQCAYIIVVDYYSHIEVVTVYLVLGLYGSKKTPHLPHLHFRFTSAVLWNSHH